MEQIISSLGDILSKIQSMEDKINKLDEQIKILLDENIKKCTYCDKFIKLDDCIECHTCKEKICSYCIIDYEYQYYHDVCIEQYCSRCYNIKFTA